MPFQSKRQARWAYATDQPFAKRWGKQTRFRGLPEHKDAGIVAGAPLSGPGGLVATPGLGGRRWGNRHKDSGCTCGVNIATKEQLSPGVTRIRGNLCNVHGRYGPCDAAQSGKKKPKGGKGRAAKPKKPVVTPEQRATARAAEQAANRDKVLGGLGIAPDGQAALEALRSGAQPDAAAIERGGFVKAGLAEQAADGSYRLTASGRAALSAAASGDAGRAGDIISGARDRLGARTGRQAAAEERKRAAASAKKPAKAAGGGGKGSAKPADKQQQQAEHRDSVKQEMANTDQGLAPSGFDALIALGDGTEPSDAQGLIDQGVAERGSDGHVRLTASGRTAINAANRGDAKAAIDAISRGHDQATARAARQAATTARQQQAAADRQRKIDEQASRPPSQRSTRQRQAPRANTKRPAPTLPSRARQRQTTKDISSFAVFKDDTDAYRWVARTTTAYRDRDGEIITTKALERDAERMTQTKQYGPLRYWHIGTPDPFDALTPWGNGLDIGDTDYSIVIGRTSIESGTFTSHAIGKAFSDSAGDYELSPGFFHPPDEPNAAGEYGNIRRFERSVVPTEYGRASNLFTGMTVKEHRMDDATYKARVEAFLKDMNAKGVPEQVAAGALAGMQQADKSAEQQGIAYKSDDDPDDDPIDPWQAVVMALKDALGVEEKAAPPMDAEDDPALGGDAGIDEDAEGEPPIDDTADDGEYIGDMSPDDFKAMMAELLAPVLKMQDMVKAMGDMHGELKGMVGGVTTKSDDQDAAHLAEIATLKAEQATLQAQQDTTAAKLAALMGDQPLATAPADIDAALKSSGPQSPPDPNAPPTPANPIQALAMGSAPELYGVPRVGGYDPQTGWQFNQAVPPPNGGN